MGIMLNLLVEGTGPIARKKEKERKSDKKSKTKCLQQLASGSLISFFFQHLRVSRPCVPFHGSGHFPSYARVTKPEQ